MSLKQKTFIQKSLPTLALGIAALVALILGLNAQNIYQRFNTPDLSNTLKNATLYPKDFRTLTDFSLTDYNGNLFSKSNLNDKWTLMFFGFTNCPDVCPNTLAVLQSVYNKLPKWHDRLQVVFVSVDPERDKLSLLKEYTQYFHPDFMGVTGELDNLKVLTKDMSIHFQKQHADPNQSNQTQSGQYLVDHYTGVFLINPNAKQHALISPPHTPGVMAKDIQAIMEAY